MQKITPFLWFDGRAGEAAAFYTAIFKNSKIVNASTLPDGKMITGTIVLDGQEFMLLDGGPMFKFTEAISLFVKCETQEEVDELWEKLSEGGQPSRCGWLKDKFGLSWQIVPNALGRLMGDPDRKKAQAVMAAMMQMGKIEIAKLQEAYDNA
ncbi:MAG: VOC family protein [Bacteroidia bacterium]|nr:VOC family protein [Bacteroidia bacterium]